MDQLLSDCFKKRDSESEQLRYTARRKYFKDLAEVLSGFSDREIKGDTLYRNVYLQIEKARRMSKQNSISVSWRFLNAMSQYSYGLPFNEDWEKQRETAISEEFNPVDDPEEFDFPLIHPCFPATPTLPCFIQGHFGNRNGHRIYVKDESHNPTGTHTDRWAHEIYKYCRDSPITFHRFILITSGWNVFALIHALSSLAKPYALYVFCTAYVSDEQRELLEWLRLRVPNADIKYDEMGPDGEPSQRTYKTLKSEGYLDLNWDEPFRGMKSSYYDWLCYEILNQNANVVIVPIGTGDLFLNLLLCHQREVVYKRLAKRFLGNRNNLILTRYYGVIPDDVGNRAPALAFNPRMHEDAKEALLRLKRKKMLNMESGILKTRNISGVEHSRLTALGVNGEVSGLIGFAALSLISQSIRPMDKVLVVNLGKVNLSYIRHHFKDQS